MAHEPVARIGERKQKMKTPATGVKPFLFRGSTDPAAKEQLFLE
jgi:hypothetical protein